MLKEFICYLAHVLNTAQFFLPRTEIVILFVNLEPTPLSASQVYTPFRDISTLFITSEPDGEVLTLDV